MDFITSPMGMKTCPLNIQDFTGDFTLRHWFSKISILFCCRIWNHDAASRFNNL